MPALSRTITGLGCALALGLAAASGASPAVALSAAEVNEAAVKPGPVAGEGIEPAVLRAQILLDRLRFSPGSIDGRVGDNFTRALDAFASANGLPPAGKLTPELFGALVGSYGGPALVSYRIGEADVKGPFLKKLPTDFEDMAELDALSYTSALEGLAERFHASPRLLEALNPKADFETAGQELTVPAARQDPDPSAITNRNVSAGAGGQAPVVRIEVDKTNRMLRAYGRDGKVIATYPATIGSEEKPAPSGRFEIRATARNPTYTYDPDYAFKGVKTKKKLTIPAGPNNPVGAVWLDLTAESYGIHGTPEPERIGKTFSHGCVRLTNWDVKDLASIAGKGTAVEFKE